jgi:hypothetical protein
MAQVPAKFRPYFRNAMLDGTKTMTSRTRALGKVGDQFEAFGATFEFTHIMRMELRFVVSDCFEQEGCKSVQELMSIWKDIHQKRGFVPADIVWAHCFRRVA